MPILSVYVSDDDHQRLAIFAKQHGRQIDELAESAVSEAAVRAVPKINGQFMDPEHRKIAAGDYETLSKEA